MNLVIVVGTRPEIVKMAPVLIELEKRKLDFSFIHTGQHYDYDLSRVFIDRLNLPSPNVSFELKKDKPASQIGEMMQSLDSAIGVQDGSILVIQGDTNTMLAAAISGIKLNMRVAHIESGLRSYDWRMPEEHNRRMVDHISDFLFAPTQRAKKNLLDEKVHGKVFVTGNTVVDAIRLYIRKAEFESQIMQEIDFDEFALVTFHRTENVDEPKTLGELVKVLLHFPIPVVLPLHPRTKKQLFQNNLYTKISSNSAIKILPPVDYFDFLLLMKNSQFILTDSGGIQEEATTEAIQKFILIARESTERPEVIDAGYGLIVGTESKTILGEVEKLLEQPPHPNYPSPFGDGLAAKRIINTLSKA